MTVTANSLIVAGSGCICDQLLGMTGGKSIPPMAVEAVSPADHGGGHGGANSKGGEGGHGSDKDKEGYETPNAGYFWLVACFIGIMASFIVYGIVMEFATSGNRKLHELSMIFLTSLMYSVTAYYGRYVNREVGLIEHCLPPRDTRRQREEPFGETIESSQFIRQLLAAPVWSW